MWEYLRCLERVNDTTVTKFLDLFEDDPRRSAHKFERRALGPRNRFGGRTGSTQVERLDHELKAADIAFPSSRTWANPALSAVFLHPQKMLLRACSEPGRVKDRRARTYPEPEGAGQPTSATIISAWTSIGKPRPSNRCNTSRHLTCATTWRCPASDHAVCGYS
jgi:hypothetical protein